MKFVKSVTSKPVVTVGRFTSPDMMISQVKRGIVDFIGAARPSIADPYLPNKIMNGQTEDIRECIGCNICYTGDSLGVPIRCTQNPTMGEEWRKGWHPEKIPTRGSHSKVLVVGAGPAGLEAARALGQRGYKVMLAEATRDLGGRVTREAKLPGLAEWARVRDYRVQQLASMPNVEIFRESELTAEDVFAVEADHVAIATGAIWRVDRFDGNVYAPIAGAKDASAVLTPDDIMAGKLPQGRVLVFDDDRYYMASVIAERLALAGITTTYVTPSDSVASWAENTGERWRVRTRLVELGVEIITAHGLDQFGGDEVSLKCEYSGNHRRFAADAVVMVSQRKPKDALYHEIQGLWQNRNDGPQFSLRRIGDCNAPAIIAASVYAGHRYARELDTEIDSDAPLRHDRMSNIDFE